jgi:hypothetical protein
MSKDMFIHKHKVSNYKRTSVPSMTPQKKAIYEMLVLLETHLNRGRPQHKHGYVLSIRNRLTVDPKREKLQNEIAEGPEISAGTSLITLDQLYAEAVEATFAVSPEEELEGANVNEARESSNSAPSAATAAMITAVSGKRVCKHMGNNASVLGMDLLWEKNILEIRESKTRMSEEKCLLREYIVNTLSNTNNHRSVNFSSRFFVSRVLSNCMYGAAQTTCI